jgi:hypothetical protein
MHKAIDLINDSEWESDGTQSTITFLNVEKLMIEFAKLHVEAALKEASEKCTYTYSKGNQIWIITGHIDKTVEWGKHEILNSYPLNLIK